MTRSSSRRAILAGAVVFLVLIAIWFTSAYWFFSTFGIHR